jgi:hypothetical protein
MSDCTPRLPDRPSLEQLRKRAKQLLKQLRNGDPLANERLRNYKPGVSDPILADAQFVIAREHGFESWPKLVQHLQAPDLEQHRLIATDLLAVYNSSDVEAATRLNDLFHSALDIQQIRDFIRDKLFNLPHTERCLANFTMSDAQHVVARLYGFKDWDELAQSRSELTGDPHAAPFLLSSKPPFYRIDWTNNSIEPRQPMRTKDWEDVCAVIREFGFTAINS